MRFDKLEEDSQQMILNGKSAILRVVARECHFVCSSTENDGHILFAHDASNLKTLTGSLPSSFVTPPSVCYLPISIKLMEVRETKIIF